MTHCITNAWSRGSETQLCGLPSHLHTPAQHGPNSLPDIVLVLCQLQKITCVLHHLFFASGIPLHWRLLSAMLSSSCSGDALLCNSGSYLCLKLLDEQHVLLHIESCISIVQQTYFRCWPCTRMCKIWFCAPQPSLFQVSDVR